MGLLSWLGLAPDQDLLAAGLAADAQNADLSRQFKERGVMTKADYTMAMDHYEASYNQLAEDGAVTSPGGIFDYKFLQAEPAGEFSFFGEQVSQQADENGKATLNAVGWGLGLIPWWVWILGILALAGYLFFTLGGLPWARKKFALS